MVLATNNLPRAPAGDYAFWQRIRVIKYQRRYVTGTPNLALGELPADEQLPKKLREQCGPAILAKMVRGCLTALRDGLNPPYEITTAVAGYQRQEDLVRQWLDDRCEFGPAYTIGAREGHKNFKDWYNQNISDVFPAPGPKKFSVEMARLLNKDRDQNNNVIYRGAQITVFLS
jgi:putative DNA primase/helicase